MVIDYLLSAAWLGRHSEVWCLGHKENAKIIQTLEWGGEALCTTSFPAFFTLHRALSSIFHSTTHPGFHQHQLTCLMQICILWLSRPPSFSVCKDSTRISMSCLYKDSFYCPGFFLLKSILHLFLLYSLPLWITTTYDKTVFPSEL